VKEPPRLASSRTLNEANGKNKSRVEADAPRVYFEPTIMPPGKDGAALLVRYNNRRFAKRMISIDASQMGNPRKYLHSSINLSFDGGNPYSIQKTITA